MNKYSNGREAKTGDRVVLTLGGVKHVGMVVAPALAMGPDEAGNDCRIVVIARPDQFDYCNAKLGELRHIEDVTAGTVTLG